MAMTGFQHLTVRVVQQLRRVIYRVGIDPRPGSIWYSPTLVWKYGMKDTGKWVAEGIRNLDPGLLAAIENMKKEDLS